MAVTTTFYGRALERFKNRANGAYQRGMDWYKSARKSAHDLNEKIMKWVSEHPIRSILIIGVLVFIGIIILFVKDLLCGQIADPVKVGVGGLIGGPLLGLIVGGISAVVIYFSLPIIDKILVGLIYVLLFTPILIGAIFYGIYLLLIVAAQFVLLIPLSMFFIMNGLWLLWRRIFYTCPNIECSFRREGIYRGFPIHVCPSCGEQHDRLWPNTYGLLHHPCTCGHDLPTLDILGRNTLIRLCAVCQTTLPDKKLPEELIALAGGPSVGKTAFLLVSTQKLLKGVSKNSIHAEIPVPRQKAELGQGIDNLSIGIEPAKTNSSLIQAYQLLLQRGPRKTWLYYYDAPGEVFSSIDRYGRHENVRHLNGLLLLVDPFSLEGLKHEAAKEPGELRASITPFKNVVDTTIITVRRMHEYRKRSVTFPLAVVITKADAKSVRKELGEITQKLPSNTKCKQALIKWGAEHSLRPLEQTFKNVRYFACSSLGRSPQTGDSRPFQGYGVLEPLLWILNKK